jgi:hypothetical protein
MLNMQNKSILSHHRQLNQILYQLITHHTTILRAIL